MTSGPRSCLAQAQDSPTIGTYCAMPPPQAIHAMPSMSERGSDVSCTSRGALPDLQPTGRCAPAIGRLEGRQAEARSGREQARCRCRALAQQLHPDSPNCDKAGAAHITRRRTRSKTRLETVTPIRLCSGLFCLSSTCHLMSNLRCITKHLLLHRQVTTWRSLKLTSLCLASPRLDSRRIQGKVISEPLTLLGSLTRKQCHLLTVYEYRPPGHHTHALSNSSPEGPSRNAFCQARTLPLVWPPAVRVHSQLGSYGLLPAGLVVIEPASPSPRAHGALSTMAVEAVEKCRK